MAEGSSVSDEIREQRKKWKSLPFRKKLQYFWDYYKWQTLLVVFVLFAVGSFLYTLATEKEPALYVDFVNGNSMADTETMEEAFLRYAGLDPDQYSALLNPGIIIDLAGENPYSMAGYQKIMAEAGSDTLDVMLGQKAAILHYAKSGYFQDLSGLLPEEYLEAHEADLLLYDVEDDDRGEYPVAVRLHSNPLLTENEIYYEGDEDVYFSILVTSSRTDTAVTFFHFLTEE